MRVNVLDSSYQGLGEVDVYIKNSNLNPNINISTKTNSQGELIVPALPQDTGNNYYIRVTKEGYSEDYTTPITVENPNPLLPHQSIIENEVTPISFYIDQLSSINITTLEYETPNNIIPNISISISGEKIIGYDGGGSPIYRNIIDGVSTNIEGTLFIDNIEWDNYTIIENDTNYDLAEIIPPNPIYIAPDNNSSAILKLAPHTNHSLRILVLDDSDMPIPDADVRLHNSTLGFDEIKNSSQAGQVFFSDLQNQTYTLEINKIGYESFSDEMEVDGQTDRTVLMAQP
jgi:hypothetical protein